MSTTVPDRAEQEAGAAGSLVDGVMRSDKLSIVGLGGSAGAIPALRRFMESVPESTGMAFVVLVHLDPAQESRLAEVLQHHTRMRVVRVVATVRVEPDTVYVIPPGKMLRMMDDHLQLAEFTSEQPGRYAVDLFFRTLADTHGSHGIAIVLSGADSDGAIGIKRIKERGGLTIAQDPEEAEHPTMPAHAIATSMVDWVLPVRDMARHVIDYVRLESRVSLPPEHQELAPKAATDAELETDLREVLGYLRSRTGRDFVNYKRATILRRIGRRMQVNGVTELAEYLDCLRTRPGETGALLQDLLISVTNFFRDADCFEALAARIPALFAGKSSADSVRVWVAACATGEEAYSIAILLAEHARTLEAPPTVQIFATDLDGEAIQAARDGVYPATIEADLSDDRLRRYFNKEHRGYRVRRELREQVMFAEHDLLKDSPFSRIDLLTCRNLLIYLNREAQKRVFDTAHFALLPHGLLFLGASETVEDGNSLFMVLDKKNRLYAPRPVPRTSLPVPVGQSAIARALEAQEALRPPAVVVDSGFSVEAAAARSPINSNGRPVSWAEMHFKLLEAIAPPSVLVDAEHEILHLSPNAGRFLQYSGGEPSRNLLHAIHPSLRIELRAALYHAAQSGERSMVAPLAVDLGGGASMIGMTVSPVGSLSPGLLLVTIDAVRPDAAAPLPASSEGAADPLAHVLDRELERLKSHLRDTVEQYEASTEELKASNEELQAMNEELRSATEELETSREELQSINEELTTVNQELKSKVDELGHSNSDMQNLMDATAIATLFLDREIRITRYTPSAVALFNLIPTDIGRPLSHLANKLDYPTLDDDARRVLQGLVPIEREVQDAQGHWYLVRLLPYRTVDDRIAGVVLTLVDITERKGSQEALRLSEQRFDAIADKAVVGVVQTTLDGRITFANRFYHEMLGCADGTLVGTSMFERIHPDDREPTRGRFAGVRADGHFETETRCLRQDGGVNWMHSSVTWLPVPEEGGGSILIVCTDVTERKDTEEALRRSEERMRLVVDNAVDYAIFSMNLEGCIVSWNAGAERLLGYTEAEVLNRSCEIIFTEEDRLSGVPALELRRALEEGRAADDRLHRRKDGRRFWASGSMMPMHDPDRRVVGFVKVLRDQTQVREAQESVAAGRVHLLHALDEKERARAELEAADVAKDRFLAVLSHELRNPLAAIAGASATFEAARSGSASASGDGDGELVERAKRILTQQVGTMSSLLDDLLDISRLRLGRFELKRRHAALATIVEAAAQAARPSIDQRRHTLSSDLPTETILLDVDPTRISQVICNLLVNAAKYTPPGGHIDVSARRTDAEVTITVTDDGRGLNREALASLFELFWRAPDLDSSSGSSMGIGLSLARNIVELHHGQLTAHSDGPGKGSQFVMRLPVAVDAPRDPAAIPEDVRRSDDDDAADAGDDAHSSLRVLLADDNEDVVWTQAAVLAARGFQVRTAASGEQALQLMEEFRPDVALLDIAMPGLTGTEVAMKVRQQPWGRDMLLIAATGWGTEPDRQRSLNAGFDDHLVKPIKLDELSRRLSARARAVAKPVA
jgi:two-component system, chemotaxis family, CheB/CheR fusion protein